MRGIAGCSRLHWAATFGVSCIVEWLSATGIYQQGDGLDEYDSGGCRDAVAGSGDDDAEDDHADDDGDEYNDDNDDADETKTMEPSVQPILEIVPKPHSKNSKISHYGLSSASNSLTAITYLNVHCTAP